jgi:hypothetical protein
MTFRITARLPQLVFLSVVAMEVAGLSCIQAKAKEEAKEEGRQGPQLFAIAAKCPAHLLRSRLAQHLQGRFPLARANCKGHTQPIACLAARLKEYVS